MFVYVSLCSQCDFDPISPFPSISTLTNPSSSSHPCTPGLLFRLFSGFPWAPVTPPQAILQTSTEQKSLYSPSTDSRSLLACQSEPPACPSGPPTVCLQQISILLLPPYMASLTQHEIWSSEEAAIHTCLCSHRPPQPKALRLPCYTPEPHWSPGLCSHLLGEAPPTHPSPLQFVPLGALCFLTIYMAAPGCSAALAIFLCVHLPQRIHTLLEAVLAAQPALLSQPLAHNLTHTKCLFFYSFITDIYISASTEYLLSDLNCRSLFFLPNNPVSSTITHMCRSAIENYYHFPLRFRKRNREMNTYWASNLCLKALYRYSQAFCLLRSHSF